MVKGGPDEEGSRARVRRKVTIKQVNDLVALSDAELVACLTALRQELTEKRWLHEAALAAGTVPAGTSFTFDQFKWAPSTRKGPRWAGPYGAETPILELPLPRRALESLQAHGLGALGDLAKACERDLLAFNDIGPGTVTQLRELLRAVGLEFATAPARALDERSRNQALQRLDPEQLRAARALLSDDAPTTRLGLYPRTLGAALRAGWVTVGALREAPLGLLAERLGKSSLREILQALEETASGLGPTHSSLELWRVGALPVTALALPRAESTPIAELEPWLGSAAARLLASADVDTLGALRRVRANGTLDRINGLTVQEVRTVKAFLLAAPR